MVKKQIMTDKLSCCGIDVSHLTLDVTYQNNLGELFYLQVGNNNAGFKKCLNILVKTVTSLWKPLVFIISGLPFSWTVWVVS